MPLLCNTKNVMKGQLEGVKTNDQDLSCFIGYRGMCQSLNCSALQQAACTMSKSKYHQNIGGVVANDRREDLGTINAHDPSSELEMTFQPDQIRIKQTCN